MREQQEKQFREQEMIHNKTVAIEKMMCEMVQEQKEMRKDISTIVEVVRGDK